VVDNDTYATKFFHAGGEIDPASPSYVQRPADKELFKQIMLGQFCYILTARQMGKSSLMSRTVQRIKDANVAPVVIDLSGMSSQMTQEELYFGIIYRIVADLKLANNALEWWNEHNKLDSVARFKYFMRDVVLVAIKKSVVIFVDEIDTTLKLASSDDFFSVIRSMYNERGHDPIYKRLTFVLLGVAAPTDLIKDHDRTPFNIGRRIVLQELNYADAAPLRRGIEAFCPGQSERILSRIFYWTSGHPYLTQRLCQTIVEKPARMWDADAVDQIVDENFFSKNIHIDPNIQSIRDYIHESFRDKQQRILVLYNDVINGEDINDDERSSQQIYLKLSGLVRVENGKLCVYNQIYRRIFNQDWVNDQVYLSDREARATVPEIFTEHRETVSTISRGLDPSDYFIDGGTLRPQALSYVTRPADETLLNKVMEGAFCYVLTARQMGKSSLMIGTARGLREHNVITALVDLTTIGTVPLEEWYLGLLTQINNELRLRADVRAFWTQHNYLGAPQRFIDFLHDVVLKELDGNIAIFIDEIDTMLNFDFRDNFFAAIRAMYNLRASDPTYKRLTFVLLGVATPLDLIASLARTPFNIGTRIVLREFSYHDATPLLQGLERYYPGQGDRILRRIFYWTSGHPYLTQRLCLATVSAPAQVWNDTNIDVLVEKTFFVDEARHDPNLTFVRDRVRGMLPEERRDLLTLYRDVFSGKTALDNDRSQTQRYLELIGLVCVEQGVLRIPNQIYRRVFNDTWIDEQLQNVPRSALLSSPNRSVRSALIAVVSVDIVLLAILIALLLYGR
jgi:AAA-like domain